MAALMVRYPHVFPIPKLMSFTLSYVEKRSIDNEEKIIRLDYKIVDCNSITESYPHRFDPFTHLRRLSIHINTCGESASA